MAIIESASSANHSEYAVSPPASSDWRPAKAVRSMRAKMSPKPSKTP